MATTLDWASVTSVVLKDSKGNTLKTDPEIWCGGVKQWPLLPAVAVPKQTGQYGTLTSGFAKFNISMDTDGVESIKNHTASDTNTHTATITIKEGYRWADGYSSRSRTVTFSLTKYSGPSVTLSTPDGTYRATISGFNPNKAYTWEEIIDAGYLTSSLDYLNYVTYDGLNVVDSSGNKVTRWDTVTSSTYTAKKAELSFTVSIYFSNGMLYSSISGTVPSDVEPQYYWRTLTGETLSTDSSMVLDAQALYGTTLRLLVKYPESSQYAEGSYLASANLRVTTSNKAQSGSYSSTCDAYLVTVDGSSYCVFSISDLPRSVPYTRYSFRRSSSSSESSWGSSTYFRRYYIESYAERNYWKTMPYARYNTSTKKWVNGGTSSSAWFNNNLDSTRLQIWITPDSSYYYRYFGNYAGTSSPN